MGKTVTSTRGQIFVPNDSFVIHWEGADVVFVRDQTRVREGHPILEGREHLFSAIWVEYEVQEATAEPGTVRG